MLCPVVIYVVTVSLVMEYQMKSHKKQGKQKTKKGTRTTTMIKQ